MRIYISHPITKGCGNYNFWQACIAQEKLMGAGFACLNPGLSMMHPNGRNIPWAQWIASDLEWVGVSELVIRLPGESKGADLETAHAEKLGIPVVRIGIEELDDWIAREIEPRKL